MFSMILIINSNKISIKLSLCLKKYFFQLNY